MLAERHIHGAWTKANTFETASKQDTVLPKFVIGNSELLAIEAVNVIAPHETPEERQAVKDGFRLRHRVFAEKKGWERENADKFEIDIYDRIATHCLLYATMRDLDDNHIERQPVSYMRLLRADRWSNTAPDKRPDVPLALLGVNGVTCPDAIRKSIDNSSAYELSRLCVEEKFKTIRIDRGPDTAINYQRTNSLHLLLVWNEAVRQSGGPRRLVGLTEPWFIKQIRSQGYEIEEMGDVVEHRGERQPFVMDVLSDRNRMVSYATLQKATEILGDVIRPNVGRVNNKPIPEKEEREVQRVPIGLTFTMC